MDWAQIRKEFPLTSDRIYLNTAGLGASPHVVIQSVSRKILELETICETGHSVTDIFKWKQSVAQLFKTIPEELAFVRNATEGINIIASGLPLKRGDEVILTTHEHVGCAAPWLNQHRCRGVVLKIFHPSMTSMQVT